MADVFNLRWQYSLVLVNFEFRLFPTTVTPWHDFRYITLNSMNTASRQYEECRIDNDNYCDRQKKEYRLR